MLRQAAVQGIRRAAGISNIRSVTFFAMKLKDMMSFYLGPSAHLQARYLDGKSRHLQYHPEKLFLSFHKLGDDD